MLRSCCSFNCSIISLNEPLILSKRFFIACGVSLYDFENSSMIFVSERLQPRIQSRTLLNFRQIPSMVVSESGLICEEM